MHTETFKRTRITSTFFPVLLISIIDVNTYEGKIKQDGHKIMNFKGHQLFSKCILKNSRSVGFIHEYSKSCMFIRAQLVAKSLSTAEYSNNRHMYRQVIQWICTTYHTLLHDSWTLLNTGTRHKEGWVSPRSPCPELWAIVFTAISGRVWWLPAVSSFDLCAEATFGR